MHNFCEVECGNVWIGNTYIYMNMEYILEHCTVHSFGYSHVDYDVNDISGDGGRGLLNADCCGS